MWLLCDIISLISLTWCLTDVEVIFINGESYDWSKSNSFLFVIYPHKKSLSVNAALFSSSHSLLTFLLERNVQRLYNKSKNISERCQHQTDSSGFQGRHCYSEYAGWYVSWLHGEQARPKLPKLATFAKVSEFVNFKQQKTARFKVSWTSSSHSHFTTKFTASFSTLSTRIKYGHYPSMAGYLTWNTTTIT